MQSYYMNTNTSTNPNRDHEVHTASCRFCPSALNRIYLGEFSSGVQAVQKARAMGYSKVDGCYHCCPEAHHG